MTEGGSHQSKPVRSFACSDMVVLGLPYSLTEDTLKDYFEKEFGPVDLYNIKRVPDSTKSLGFGFVRMKHYDDQVRALSFTEHKIGNRPFYCRLARRRGYDAENEDLTTNPRLFVTKLNEKISRKCLSDFFLQHARLIDRECTIINCYISHERGFGFITFSSPKVARELLRQTDFVIDGHFIYVKLAVPRNGGGEMRPIGGRFGSGHGQCPLPFNRSEPPSPMRTSFASSFFPLPLTRYDAKTKYTSYHRQTTVFGGSGGIPKHGERSWYYRGDHRRHCRATLTRKQYVSDSGIFSPQRYDVENYECVWKTSDSVSQTSSSSLSTVTATASDHLRQQASSSSSSTATVRDPPPGPTREIMRTVIKWMKQSNRFSVDGGRDNGDYELIFI